MRSKIPDCRRSAPYQACNPTRISLCNLAPWIFLLGVALILLFGGCSENISETRREHAARGLTSVLVAIQSGADSASRHQLADSAARTRNFEDWNDLRTEISEIGLFPEEFRNMLDTASNRLMPPKPRIDTLTR